MATRTAVRQKYVPPRPAGSHSRWIIIRVRQDPQGAGELMKRMPLVFALTSLLCMALVPALGQQTGGPQWQYMSPIELHSSSRVETLLPAEGGVIGPIRCDADQNMYWLSEAGSLLRMSSDGQRITSFDVEAVTKLRQISTTRGEIADFAVTPDGKLYASVHLGEELLHCGLSIQ